MTLLDLSKAIQKDPSAVHELIAKFPAQDATVRSFLESIKDNTVYVIPGLIERFANSYGVNPIKTLSELMEDKSCLGGIFVLLPGQEDYYYLGISKSGNPLCRKHGSCIVEELSPSDKIKWVF